MSKSASLGDFVYACVIVGLSLGATAIADRRGWCGDGDFRPPCAGFAFGLVFYGMIGVSAVGLLTTVATYVMGRRTPVLLKTASILIVGAVGIPVFAMWVAGNKLAGAIILMGVAPFALTLLVVSSACVLLWLGNVTGAWIQRRVGAPAGLPQNR